MLQLTFSEQSMEKLKAISLLERVELIRLLTELNLREPDKERELRKLSRNQFTFYRYRQGNWRFYLQSKSAEELHVYCVLDKNGLADFIFRCKLPYNDETLVEEHEGFIDYLRSLIQGNSK